MCDFDDFGTSTIWQFCRSCGAVMLLLLMAAACSPGPEPIDIAVFGRDQQPPDLIDPDVFELLDMQFDDGSTRALHMGADGLAYFVATTDDRSAICLVLSDPTSGTGGSACAPVERFDEQGLAQGFGSSNNGGSRSTNAWLVPERLTAFAEAIASAELAENLFEHDLSLPELGELVAAYNG